jgi:hypothetical protein
MPRMTRLIAVLSVLVLGLVGTAGADPALVESETRLFLANSGTDCGAGDAPFLTTEARTTDINCGYIGGGIPFGEVAHQTGALEAGRTFGTRANAGGVPFVADAGRDVSGVVTVRRGSQQGVALPGGGQIVADIALRMRTGTQTIDLGTQSLEVVAVPGAERVELPFTFDVPASLQGAEVTSVQFDLNVRGVHLFHGFMELNGRTSLAVPTLVEAVEAGE